MIVCYNNYIENSVLTESSSISGNPVSNVAISQLARYFSFDGNSGNIVIDLLSSKNITAIILGSTNMTSSGTITIEGNTSDSWTSPLYQETITIDDNATNQILILNQTYQYFRIVCNDSSLTNITMGHIFIGTYLSMPGFNINKEEPEMTTGAGRQSKTLQFYGNRGLRAKNPSFTFPVTTDNQKKEIIEMFNHVQNTEIVYLVVYENTISERPPLFCVINQDVISFRQINIDQFTFKLDFLEVK